MLKLPIRLGVLRGLFKELRVASEDRRPIAVGGARELAPVLRRELVRDGDASAVRTGDPEGAATYVHVLAGAPDEEDEDALKRARRAKVPAVVVAAGPAPLRIPHVLATDVVRVAAGSGFPVDEIARVVAHRLGEASTPLAARLPVLRGPVCAELIDSFARKNGILGAAIFIPGVDMPVMTLNEIRLVLRIAAAHGEEIDQQRLPELLGVLGAGWGLRAVARQALDVVPIAGWAVKGAVAYAGTRALGEAAVRFFSRRSESRHPASTRPPAAASRAAS